MSTAKKVIAVVDDDEFMLEALEQFLSALSYQTELYKSAEAFIVAATKSEAACLVVDIQLGDISGIELGRQLSAMGFTFPIILMTGSDDYLFRKQAMELGCIAFLKKPFPVDEIAKAIADAI
ncbi:MAG TPA: response regulator [Xanthobacteraceae bacterium]|nr:response regulator [Xanthobacteraceae bacterium]